MNWKCGNDGKSTRSWFVYQENPTTGQAARYHRTRTGALIKFGSHDAAHRRMLQLNEAP